MACVQHAVVKDVAEPNATARRGVAGLISKDCIRTGAGGRVHFGLVRLDRAGKAAQSSGKRDEAGELRVSDLGWSAKGRGAQADARARGRDAPSAAGLEVALSGARDLADAQ